MPSADREIAYVPVPHENKYYHEPGNVTDYTPDLTDGARTDDDTDIEWVYIVAMRNLLLNPWANFNIFGMRLQGWSIKDSYRNTTRPLMPDNETITSFAARIIVRTSGSILCSRN